MAYPWHIWRIPYTAYHGRVGEPLSAVYIGEIDVTNANRSAVAYKVRKLQRAVAGTYPRSITFGRGQVVGMTTPKS